MLHLLTDFIFFLFSFFTSLNQDPEVMGDDPSLQFYQKRRSKFSGPCPNCFPSASIEDAESGDSVDGIENGYINMFDFSKFGGFCKLNSLENYDTRNFSGPWFADVLYTLKTPLPHRYHSVYNFVLESKRVKRAIEQVSQKDNKPIKVIQKQAIKVLCAMKASLNRFICRICGYVLYKIFRRVMNRLLVNPAQLMKLREAEASGIPIVYLPLHRSHLDYLLITWTVWHFGLRLPHIASGDNLNLSGFGWLLRATGAFFIHRKLDPNDDSNKNEIYRAVLNSYMVETIRSGMCLEFFLEGTRSRFGKTLLPKNGLISNIVEAVDDGTIPDVYLVPVSYSYDNIVEGIFHEELMGIRKEKESFLGVVRGVFKGFGRRGKCGTVTIDFGSPCKLTDYMKSLRASLTENRDHFNLQYSTNPNSYRELLPWHDSVTPNRTLIRAIGYHVIFEAHQQKPITIQTCVALLMLCHHRKRTRVLQFIRDLRLLCAEIKALGYEVVGWGDQVEPDRAFEYAATHCRHSISLTREHADAGIEGVWIQLPPNHYAAIDLCYRKNGGIAPFALISVVAMTLLGSELDPTKDAEQQPLDDLINKCLVLCNILQTEVIFCRPCENLKEKIGEIVIEFLRSIRSNSGCTFKGHELSFPLSFYANILRQYVQSLFIVVEYFLANPKPNRGEKREIDFIRSFLLAKSRNRDPAIYSEAYNSDSVYNGIKLLRQKQVIAEDRLELIDREHAEHIIKLVRPFVYEPSVMLS